MSIRGCVFVVVLEGIGSCVKEREKKEEKGK